MLLRAVPLGQPGSALPDGACTPGELQRAAAILDPQRRHGFLAGRLALRALVAELVDVDPRLIVPAYTCPECGPGEHGQPGFELMAADDAGRRLPLHVAASVSRAAGWALLAVAGAGVRLGVDLARVADFRVADFRGAIPDAAFSARERRRAYRSTDPPAEAARLWARKEALLKAAGTGLRGDLAAVEAERDRRVRDVNPGAVGLPAGFAAAVARLEL